MTLSARSPLWPSLAATLVFTVLTGIVYPLVLTLAGRLVFPRQAGGSLIVVDGRPVASALLGQPTDASGYFWGRPSGTAPVPYNGTASSGTNQGPSNPALLDAVRDRVAALHAAGFSTGPVPIDLVTASASGLDPHISPAAAEYQVARVAQARGVAPERVRALIHAATEGRQLGVLGEPRVNVLRLNRALDALTPPAQR